MRYTASVSEFLSETDEIDALWDHGALKNRPTI